MLMCLMVNIISLSINDYRSSLDCVHILVYSLFLMVNIIRLPNISKCLSRRSYGEVAIFVF